MRGHELWWLCALALGIAEMLTGTFYLLILAIGCVAAGFFAISSDGFVLQAFIAALITMVGWFGLHRWMSIRGPRAVSAQANRDVLLDIGEEIHIDHWQSAGKTQVRYRGALWEVELESSEKVQPVSPLAGDYRISRMLGNRLIVIPLN